jgi:hypothetical protein
LDPPGLPARDLLRLAEILEVFMVGANADGVFGTEEKRATTLETENNTKEFLVMGVVVGFCWEETAGMEGNRVQPVLVFLGDDDPESVAGCVRVENKLSVPVGCAQDGMHGTTLFQGAESEFTLGRPIPGPKFLR